MGIYAVLTYPPVVSGSCHNCHHEGDSPRRPTIHHAFPTSSPRRRFAPAGPARFNICAIAEAPGRFFLRARTCSWESSWLRISQHGRNGAACPPLRIALRNGRCLPLVSCHWPKAANAACGARPGLAAAGTRVCRKNAPSPGTSGNAGPGRACSGSFSLGGRQHGARAGRSPGACAGVRSTPAAGGWKAAKLPPRRGGIRG